MKLSPHFTLEELTRSATALERDIDNEPDDDIVGNLKVLAVGLEAVRAMLGGHALHINSGYRCEQLNIAVRGSKNSAHMRGLAADFTCNGFGTPLEVVQAIVASDIQFDQCIQEGKWVHISFDPQLRRQIMTAHFDSAGNATYTKGA